uniref:Transmembrane protein 8B-like n=1 Tax=Saccoglossus kowalevskii TaxID=10224 RepID=A0ABM0MUJ1_SACKO
YQPKEKFAVTLCLRNGAPSVYQDGSLQCEEDTTFVFDTTRNEQGKFHIPYPEPGIWYITMDLYECSDDKQVSLQVNMHPCILNCNGKGDCKEYFSGQLLFATCVCKYNYRGWACTDDTYAHDESFLLLQTLLLSLSNLFFIPAIILSAYRLLFIESLVYFYTMFFSSFYHACDSSGEFCIMDYDTLQYCDFHASVCAFWVTLIAMTKFKLYARSFLHVLGILVLVVLTKYDRFSLWIFVVPVVTGLVLIGGSWINECYTKRHCFPHIQRILFCIIPGIFTAATGLVLYSFVETDFNYYYIHSIWHVIIVVSILFLLPGKSKSKLSENLLVRVPSSEHLLTEEDGEDNDQAHPI